MVSYAQAGEDVVLRRVLGDQPPGLYVDLGANDPVADSVTKHFYDHGWRGVNVEPVPSVFAQLAAARSDDVNLNVAAGGTPRGPRFCQVPDFGGGGLALAGVEDAGDDGGRERPALAGG